jgi:hypothetical protein
MIRNKRGQISIFVIVGLILVAAVIIIFVVFRSPDVTLRQDFDNPESFIDKCVRDEVRATIDIMIPQGGFVAPSDTVVFNDIQVPYLCKNINYYDPCITQYPLYITSLQEELETQVKSKVESCFVTLEAELEDRNYVVSGGEIGIDVTLKPRFVEVVVDRDFTLTRNDATRTFESFEVVVNSRLYDIAVIANEISSQEARFCYFEYVGYNVLYNDFDVRKAVLSDSTKVYTIKDKKTEEEMNIAVRGCAIPAGF